MAPALPHKLHELSPFPLGTVVKWPEVSEPGPYSSIAKSQFNSFTPEIVFKSNELYPARDKFVWDKADAFVDFSLSHHKKIHGHTLIWDRAMPDWMQKFDSPGDHVLPNYVGAVVSRYKNKVRAWDVANETFDENGKLKKGIWHRIGGENYIARAFTAAREADAGALLFYNDFDLEANETKRKGVIAYLNRLRNSGTPVHGVGLQFHLNISSANVSSLEKALVEFADNGYLIHISELDVSVNPYHGIISGKEELYQAQAKLLWLVFEKYMKVPPALRYGITFWGVGDADSWLTNTPGKVDYPLLFDEDYQPKPAWYTLVDMFTR